MTDKIWLDPRRVVVGPDSSEQRTVTYPGVSAVTSVTVTAYDGSATAAILAADGSVSGNVVTLPTWQNLSAGRLYVIQIKADEDTQTRTRKFELQVHKAGQRFGAK